MTTRRRMPDSHISSIRCPLDGVMKHAQLDQGVRFAVWNLTRLWRPPPYAVARSSQKLPSTHHASPQTPPPQHPDCLVPPRSLRNGFRTPDQRLRVFISSTLDELAPERGAVRDAIASLQLTPVIFEAGARPYPAQDLYRAYLAQSDVPVGIYWHSYGRISPGMEISGLEEDPVSHRGSLQLIYIKRPSPEREPELQAFLARVRSDDVTCTEVLDTRGVAEACSQ